MTQEEIDERTEDSYLAQLSRDNLESGREQTSADYEACRLKIASLKEQLNNSRASISGMRIDIGKIAEQLTKL